MHTVSFDCFLSGLEWIINLEFCFKVQLFWEGHKNFSLKTVAYIEGNKIQQPNFFFVFPLKWIIAENRWKVEGERNPNSSKIWVEFWSQNQLPSVLEPVCCKKWQKKSSRPVTGLRTRGPLKILNGIKLILEDHMNHSLI